MTRAREIAAAVEGDKEDRISALPRDIIDGILKRLPTKDAAITSILSKNWRYIWAMLPNVVLDHYFFDSLALQSESFFKQAVDDILAVHLGDILKFFLYVPGELMSSHKDIDRWLFCATRNGVKKLKLFMPADSSYRLPLSVFNCPTLTTLSLGDCVIRPPKHLFIFQNLVNLCLEQVTIMPTTNFWVIKFPRLVYLDLRYCCGTQYLNIVSPGLESLWVFGVDHYLVLNCFMNCKQLSELIFRAYAAVINLDYERSTLEKLFLSLASTVEILELDSYYLELLRADTVPRGSPFMFNCLWDLSLSVNFGKLSSTSGALRVLRSVPNLVDLAIWVYAARDAKAVLKYLNTPACLDQSLNNLKHVLFQWFNGSKAELLFIKLLFAHAPSLARMTIMQLKAFDSVKQRNISRELTRFHKACPNAELVYLDYSS